MMLLEPELQGLDLILWQYVFCTPPFRCNMPRFGRRFFLAGVFVPRVPEPILWSKKYQKTATPSAARILWRLGVMIPLSPLGCFFFTILLYHRRPYDYFWDHIKWRPCCLDHPLVFFQIRFLEFVPTKSGQVQRQGFEQKEFHQCINSHEKTKDGAFGWGVERWLGLKIGHLWTNFLGCFFLVEIWVMSRNLEFRGCFRTSRCALSFGGLVMESWVFLPKTIFFFESWCFFWGIPNFGKAPVMKIKVLRLSGWVFWGHQSITLWAEQIGR